MVKLVSSRYAKLKWMWWDNEEELIKAKIIEMCREGGQIINFIIELL